MRDELRTEMSEGFGSICEELRDIRRATERLQTRVGNMEGYSKEGYSKEIDHHMERVRADRKTSRHRDQNRRLIDTIDYTATNATGLTGTSAPTHPSQTHRART